MRNLKRILLFCLLCVILVGCSNVEEEHTTKRSDREKKEKQTEDAVYCIESEQAVDKAGKLIYKIEYFYDNKGNEEKRVAYDSNGENEYWLSYAYDTVGWKDNMHREPEEVNEGRWFSLDMNYEFFYDKKGCLVKAVSCGENPIDYIEYTYKQIEIDSKAVEEDGEDVSNSEDEDATADNIEDDKMTLKEKLYDYEGLINVSGEMCHAIWGETGALVWQWHDSTFEEDVHLSYAMATDMAEVNSYGSDSSEEWDAFRFMNWSVLYGVEEPFLLYHIGDDMFMLEGTYLGYYDYSYYINGNSRIKFTPESVLKNEKDFFYRHTDYSDGYAICQYKKAGYDTTSYLTLMDKYGELTISDIPIYNRDVETVPCGIYSDGWFYYNWAFYDINFNKVLDLAGGEIGTPYVNQGLYTPHFVDGICTMVTEKNGKYWIFDINKSGEIISEVEEFDIWSLNI